VVVTVAASMSVSASVKYLKEWRVIDDTPELA
jgi:hypothetical protein